MSWNEDFSSEEGYEKGSDDLLSDDRLRLPEDANPLVRLHAVRSWLKRRQKESTLLIGQIALEQQQLYQEENGQRLRRRELMARQERHRALQQIIQEIQERLAAYEEAEGCLEDCVNHTTVSERLLVEYYLTIQNSIAEKTENQNEIAPHTQALLEVLQRVEQVGISFEQE